MNARIYAISLSFFLIATTSSCHADTPVGPPLKDYALASKLSVKLPAAFQLQKIAETPLTYVAVGPSPNSTGTRRPAVLMFLSVPIKESEHGSFFVAAKKAAENTIKKFGLAATEFREIETKNGIVGANAIATNSEGKSWWAVRTIHLHTHSVQMIIGTFDETEFSPLCELVNGFTSLRD